MLTVFIGSYLTAVKPNFLHQTYIFFKVKYFLDNKYFSDKIVERLNIFRSSTCPCPGA